MKYILIFWLAHNQPSAVPGMGAFACVQGLRVLQGQLDGVKGMCVPMGGEEGNYHRLFTDVNPTFPN